MPLPVLPELKVEVAFTAEPFQQPEETVGVNAGWIDVTSRVRRVSFTRGRSDDLQQVSAGTAEVVLDNRDREFDPMNTASTYAGSILPRRQVRISGYYPNDPQVDGFCYNLQDSTTRTPSAGAFDEEGYYLLTPVLNGVEANFTTTFQRSGVTDITVIFRIGARGFVPWNDAVYKGNYICQIAGAFFVKQQDGIITVKRDGSPYATLFTVPLPASVASTTDSFWMKLVISTTTANHKAYYCPDQFQVPTTWTDLTSTATLSSALPSSSASNTALQISPSIAYVLTPPGGADPYMEHSLKRIQVFTYNGTTTTQYIDLLCAPQVTLFRGFNSGWKQGYGRDGKDNVVSLNCFDALGLIGNQNMPTDLVQVTYENLSAVGKYPWGWWRLGEGGDVAIDYTTNQNDLVIGGRVMSSERLAAGLQGGSSMVGFNKPGVFSIATTAPYPNMYSGAIAPSAFEGSLSFWVNTTQNVTAGSGAVLFCLQDVAGGYNAQAGHLIMRLISDGTVRVDVFNTDVVGSISSGSSTTKIDDGVSHYVTFTTSGTSQKLYIDGVLESTFTAKPYWGGYVGIAGNALTSPTLTNPINAISNIYFVGLLQDFTFWSGDTLSAAEITEIYEAGFGSIEETSGTRVGRILDSLNVPAWIRTINSTTYAVCGATEYTENQKVLEAIQKVEASEQGFFYVNREGKFTFLNRYYLSTADTGINVQAAFDDTGTNIGYRNLEFTYDADQLINDHIVTDDIGEQYQSSDDTSVNLYGRTSRTIDTLLIDTADARDMAIGLTNIYKTPILRAEPFEVVPLGEQWLDVLPLDLNMRMNLQSTPLGVGDTIDQDLALQQLQYDIEGKTWRVQVIGSPRPVISYFVLGDSTVDTLTRTNLVPNPSFETNNTSWSTAQSAITRSTAFALYGSGSLTTTMSSTTDSNAFSMPAGTVTINQTGTYTVSAYVYVPTGSTIAGRTITISFEGGGMTSSGGTSQPATLVAGQWVRCSYTARNFTSISGTSPAIVFRLSGTLSTAVGQAIYLDGCLLEYSSTLNTYFDGGLDPYAYGTTPTLAWTGTANNSTSTRTAARRRVNIMPNPSLEVNLTNTSAYQATSTRVAASWGFGSWAQQTVATVTNTGGPFTGPIAVDGGITYTGSIYGKYISGTARQFRVTIEFYNSAGGYISGTSGTPVLLSATPQRMSVTAVAPAGARTMYMVCYSFTAGAIGDTFQFDGYLIEQGSTLGTYFDGYTAGLTTGYVIENTAWTGAANNSTSFETLGNLNSLGSELDGPDVLGF